MSSAQSFSSSAEDVITKTSNVVPEKTPSEDSDEFFDYYGIERTVRFIGEGNYKRIALQFPDELLHDATPVYFALRERLSSESEAYVLADTSYGSCCVDEVAASHVDADLIVHYGHACLSQTSRLPVVYVFGRKSLDVNMCVEKIGSHFRTTEANTDKPLEIRLRHDVSYSYLSKELVERLRDVLVDLYEITYDPLPDYTFPASASKEDSPATKEPEKITLPSSRKKTTLWIGEESASLTKLVMTAGGDEVVSYSPSSNKVVPQTYLTNKLLMRRYAILQKARDSDVFGILVGTLGVASYLPMIKHIRTRIRAARKKSYTVSVGKINPAKLANFMEIECWVWVACSESMVDSKEFLRPIITPYELELALLEEPTWTGKYILDFQEVLANSDTLLEDEKKRTENASEDTDLDPERPMFSLVTGKYRKAKKYGQDNEDSAADNSPSSTDLVKRSSDNALAKLGNSAAAHFLHERTFQGLEPRIGLDAPSILEQGRRGIARSYGDDEHLSKENEGEPQ